MGLKNARFSELEQLVGGGGGNPSVNPGGK